MSWPSGNLLPCKLNTSSKCYWTEVSVEHFVTACDLSLLLCDFVWDFKTGTCFFLPWECLTPWTLHMCFHPSCFGIQVKDWSLPLFALLLSGSPTSVWFLPTKYDVSPLAHISYHGKLVDPFCGWPLYILPMSSQNPHAWLALRCYMIYCCWNWPSCWCYVFLTWCSSPSLSILTNKILHDVKEPQQTSTKKPNPAQSFGALISMAHVVKMGGTQKEGHKPTRRIVQE